MVESQKNFTSIPIPNSLIEKIENRIKEREFASVSEYILYVLEQVVQEDTDIEETITEDNEKKVKEKLRALGYFE
jgi:Arc/MetJ-type ribon-helix-helix transcriptional regulator